MFLMSMNVQSQEGISVPLNHDPTIDIQNGTYIKDIDNVFLPYIGNWETTWENKKMTLTIEKVTKQLRTYPNGDYYYRDYLIIKYKIIALPSNFIISNTYNIANLTDAKITSIGTGKDNQLYFIYRDADFCYNSGEIILRQNLANQNELFYYYRFDGFWMPEDCPYETQQEIPVYLPTINVTLTKQ